MKLHCLPILNVGMSGRLSAFVSEYQTVYDLFTTKPSAEVAAADNTMVETIVDGDVWAKLDIFDHFAQEVNSDGEALKNWINPGTFDPTMVNAPAFVSLEGFTSDGVTSYINSNWNPNTNGVNYVQDSASIGIYIRTTVAENKADIGGYDGANFIYLQTLRDATSTRGYINDDTVQSIPQTDARGFSFMVRIASNVRTFYKNKVGTSDAEVSTAIPSREIYNLAANLDGSPGSYSTKQGSLFIAGSGLTQADVNIITDAFETRMDILGKGVIP